MKNFDSIILPRLFLLLTFLLIIQRVNGNGSDGQLLFSADPKLRKNNGAQDFFDANLLNSMRSQKFRFGLGQQFYEATRKNRKHFNFIHNGESECGGTLEANKGRLTYEKKVRRKDDVENIHSKDHIKNHGNCIWIIKLETADQDGKSHSGSKEKTGVENGIVVTIDRLRLNLQSTIHFYTQEELMINSDFPKPITFKSLTDPTAKYKSKVDPIIRAKGQTLIIVLSPDPSDTDSSFFQLHWDSDADYDVENPSYSAYFSSFSRRDFFPITTANYVVPAKRRGRVFWNSYEFHLQQRSTWILNARKHDEILSSSCGPLIPRISSRHLNLNISVDMETESSFQGKRSSSCERILDGDSFLLDSCERASFQMFEILNGGRLRRVARHCRGSLNLNVPNLTSQLVAFIQTSSTKEFGMPLKSVEISWELQSPQQQKEQVPKKPIESLQIPQRKKGESLSRPIISNKIMPAPVPTSTQTVFVESTTTKKPTTTTITTTSSTTTTTPKPTPTTMTTKKSQFSPKITTSKPQPSKRVITTTKPPSPPSPFLETNPQFQLQLQRLPPIKVRRCPSPSIISPCTCSLFTGEVHVECSGKFVVQKDIDNLFAQLRRANKIPSGRFMTLAKIVILNTQLTQLDILPFFGLEMKMFDVSFNKNFRRFLVSGRSLAVSGEKTNNNNKSNQNSNRHYTHYNPKIPIPIPKIPLIRTKKLRVVDNALTDSGFGNLLHYFSPIMEELILYKNKLGGNSHVHRHGNVEDLTLISNSGSDVPFFPGLSSLTKLSSIYLGSNQIHHLKRGQFKNNTRLMYLSLPGNGLSSLDPLAFLFNKPSTFMANQTLTIDISRNNLSQSGFPKNHGLDEIGRPVYLDLDENKFESLPRDIFENFFMTTFPVPNQSAKQVNHVTFRDNPIFCDSRLGWMKKLRAKLGKIVLNANCMNEPNRNVFSSRLVNIIKFVDKTQVVRPNETKVNDDLEF